MHADLQKELFKSPRRETSEQVPSGDPALVKSPLLLNGNPDVEPALVGRGPRNTRSAFVRFQLGVFVVHRSSHP